MMKKSTYIEGQTKNQSMFIDFKNPITFLMHIYYNILFWCLLIQVDIFKKIVNYHINDFVISL